MKQYEVEVMSYYQHGQYGKERYFGLILAADSCKQAEYFADDILYEMTYEEFFERLMKPKSEFAKKQFMSGWTCIDNGDGTYKQYQYDRKLNERIGNDHRFSYKARVFKG